MPRSAGAGTVLLLGALDTKGEEYAFVRDRLTASGTQVLVVDFGILGEPAFEADISRAEVAAAAGADIRDLAANRDRGAAMLLMAEGATRIVGDLHRDGRFSAAFAMGGTGGTSVAAAVFRRLPVGVPKMIVSTAASGDTSAYIGESDLILVPSITDVAGLNRLSAKVMANAAAAIAGMAGAPDVENVSGRPLIGASMFGVTTPCVTEARRLLEAAGYEVLVFHMTGVGGRTLEGLATSGWLAGILDATTTELADELVGGVFSAGSGRLTGAGAAGIPQVVSVGALDMVNFGPLDTVPPQFRDRNLYVHNANVTLMRTTPQECAEIGRRLATRLSAATGPTVLALPLAGVSAIAVDGGPFHDPAADAALFDAIRSTLDTGRVELLEVDTHINDPAFAALLVDRLLAHLGSAGSVVEPVPEAH